MLKYLLNTGLLGAIASGISLLRGADDQKMTWRVALAWLSWSITLILAVGTARDIHLIRTGRAVDDDSPLKGKESKFIVDNFKKARG